MSDAHLTTATDDDDDDDDNDCDYNSNNQRQPPRPEHFAGSAMTADPVTRRGAAAIPVADLAGPKVAVPF